MVVVLPVESSLRLGIARRIQYGRIALGRTRSVLDLDAFIHVVICRLLEFQIINHRLSHYPIDIARPGPLTEDDDADGNALNDMSNDS